MTQIKIQQFKLVIQFQPMKVMTLILLDLLVKQQIIQSQLNKLRETKMQD